ncbi:MAG: hypothetical protein L0241_23300 [Planctomycetia bacterium]|nr:hypothetical protein [Planctomycetia bacterium]
MSALNQAVERFLQVIDTHRNLQDLQQGMSGLHPEIPKATREELNSALRAFVPVIQTHDIVPVGVVVITCGAMLESGGDPDICGPAILDRLPNFLRDLTGFYDAVRERANPDEEITEAVIDRHMDDIFQTNRDLACAFIAEQWFSLGTIAHLSQSKELRAITRSRAELLQLAEEVIAAAGHGNFLTDILRVLDDERLIVLHPGEQKGYEVRISGIADNFQLHTLLADALIGEPGAGWLMGTKPDPAVVAQARDGEINERLIATGPFNLWNWTGLQPDGALPSMRLGVDTIRGTPDWIWNEGNPGDILPFEGVRVVLIGPPPYSRSWNACRRFPSMAGSLTVEQILAPDVVRGWLARISSTPRAVSEA